MSLYEKLSQDDRNMIDAYISAYASRKHANLQRLLRYWDTYKGQYLYKMFGEQFTLSKEIEWNMPKSKIMNEMYMLFNRSNSAAYHFRKVFDRFLWENRTTLGENYYMLQLMMNHEYLATSTYVGDEFSVMTPQGKEIKVQRGCRPMRIISRVAKAYGGIDYLDAFQTEISQVLNQRKLTGTLTISIHPMDYMTMSDNDADWSSCMSWREGGCYCRGTVEMMNSNMVVVAYLAADEEMSVPHGYYWNSKKWRELFIVTPEIITGVKGYPYQNEELVKIVNLWLKELAEKNLGWQYEDDNTNYQHRVSFTHVNPETGEAYDAFVRFHTDTMYNDFGSIDDGHYGIFGKNLDSYDIDINYSGQEICMECGSDDASFDGEGCLVCCDCDDPHYCNDCGERLSEDEIYWLDDNPYCEYCYNEHAVEDDLSNVEHDTNNMYEVRFVENEDDEDALINAPYITTYRVSTSSSTWSRYFNEDARVKYLRWSSYHYVVPAMFRDMTDIEDLFGIDYIAKVNQ